MSLYERGLETFARTPAGNWYVERSRRGSTPPLLRLTGGRVSSVYPAPVMLLTTTGRQDRAAPNPSAAVYRRRSSG